MVDISGIATGGRADAEGGGREGVRIVSREVSGGGKEVRKDSGLRYGGEREEDRADVGALQEPRPLHRRTQEYHH